MPRRRPADWSAGERAENRARSLAKKPITVLVDTVVVTAHADYTPGQRALAVRYLTRWVPDVAVRAELRGYLGIAVNSVHTEVTT